MNYSHARSVFIHKWGRYSTGEKIAIVYCVILGALLLIAPIVNISPLDDTAEKTYRILNGHLFKSAILILGSWIALLAWSVSYSFKAFVYKSIWFKDNESLFSLFLLLILLTTFVGMGDMVNLLRSNITYTMSLSNWYFITSLLLVAGIVYTLWHSIIAAKNISKASIMNSSQSSQELAQEDLESFKDHIGNNNWLF